MKKVSQQEIINRTLTKMRSIKEDPYCVFHGFIKNYVKNKQVDKLDIMENEYYITKGVKVSKNVPRETFVNKKHKL